MGPSSRPGPRADRRAPGAALDTAPAERSRDTERLARPEGLGWVSLGKVRGLWALALSLGLVKADGTLPVQRWMGRSVDFASDDTHTSYWATASSTWVPAGLPTTLFPQASTANNFTTVFSLQWYGNRFATDKGLYLLKLQRKKNYIQNQRRALRTEPNPVKVLKTQKPAVITGPGLPRDPAHSALPRPSAWGATSLGTCTPPAAFGRPACVAQLPWKPSLSFQTLGVAFGCVCSGFE